MLKRWSCLVVILLLLFGLPKNVFASDLEIKFFCSEEVMVSGTVSCRISLLNSVSEIKGIQANHKFDEVFSYVKTISGSDWTIASAHSEGLMLTNLDGITGTSAMAQVDYLVSNQAKVGEEYEFQLNDILLSDGEQDIRIDNKSSKVKILSILDVLESLSINGENLELKDGITNYEINVENNVEQVIIGAVLKSDKYQFANGYGPREVKNLSVGKNEIEVKILSEEQELISFTISVTRSSEKEEIEDVNSNPKTGNFSIFITVVILFCSIGMLIYYQKKNSLKEG